MRISDWSSDVCSSDLRLHLAAVLLALKSLLRLLIVVELALDPLAGAVEDVDDAPGEILKVGFDPCVDQAGDQRVEHLGDGAAGDAIVRQGAIDRKSTRLNSSH